MSAAERTEQLVKKHKAVRYLSVSDVAEVFGISCRTVWARVERGCFPAPVVFVGNAAGWSLGSLEHHVYHANERDKKRPHENAEARRHEAEACAGADKRIPRAELSPRPRFGARQASQEAGES